MSSSSRLPDRPSLEQLHKQAKELLRQHRAADEGALARVQTVKPNPMKQPGGDPTESQPFLLADALFVIAREHGFESWAKLKHYVESIRPPSLEQYEELAADLAAAYTAGHAMGIREINWNFGTSFVWDHEPIKMQQRLPAWFGSEARTTGLALSDAQQMVAQSYGYATWAAFAEGVVRPGSDGSGASFAIGAEPPFYTIDLKDNAINVRGPMSDRNWDVVSETMRDHKIVRLNAGGMTDAGMERVTKLDHVTHLNFDNSSQLSDEGLLRLARMPQVVDLDISGVRGVVTDRALEVLKHLPELKRFKMCWQRSVSDQGAANLAFCEHLESVNLIGTPTGDGALRALAGKPKLRRLETGRQVTDDGLPLLHQFPHFKTWQGGEIRYGLMRPDADPNRLLLDGTFSNRGIAALAGLEGLVALSFFWHCSNLTSEALGQLKDLPRLTMLGCQGKLCDDDAMRHISAIPGLRMLMAQGTIASDAGFEALSRSQTVEYIWGRECPNLTGRGFAALKAMTALRGLAVSCKNVDDAALSTLPSFPALRELMPMDVADAGFRHVGRCKSLEGLWCMYCRDTGDLATEYIAGLTNLKTYYAGQTQITDRSLETLGRMDSLEKLEFWACAGITNSGVARLTSLPRLREIALDGLPGVTRDATRLFPQHVRVSYSG